MSVRTRRELAEPPDWGVAPYVPVRLVAVGAGIGVALCAAGGVLARLIAGAGAGVAAACVIGILIAVGLAAQRRWLIATTGARPVAPGEAPRLTNLVAGRARSENASVPEVMLSERPAPNAFIWGGRRPIIAMSRDAVETFTRTEIEAVVAHCFVRLGSGAGRTLPIAVLLGRLAAWAGPLVGVTHDVATAASTRYPPALRSALTKCSPARGTFAPAFFVAEGWSHTPVGDRVRALEDL
jgi:hypothetical protein